MNSIIKEVNRIKNKFIDRRFSEMAALYDLSHEIKRSNDLSKQPAILALLDDLNLFDQTKHLRFTKDFINKGNENVVISVFDVPYFNSLSFDGFYYEKLPVDPVLKENFGNYLCPVNIINCTTGFKAREVVALFPENHIDSIQCNNDKIFYFIDKFVNRFYNITQKILFLIGSDHFAWLKTATRYDIQEAAIFWVYLHEHFHHTGSLPIPEYLHLKKIKALAGLEELRVDICSILYLINNPLFEPEKSTRIAEFILAERLLRYSIEGIPYPNYDAIASQCLFKFLENCKALVIKNDLIYLDKNIMVAINEFLQLINKTESLILECSEDYTQTKLLELIQKYINYDKKTNKYYHVDYFKRIKNRYWL